MSVCHGCDTELPPNRAPGRARKWCSERCRKQTLYARPCMDCGAPRTNGSDSAREPRCSACAAVKGGKTKQVWTPAAGLAAIQEWATLHGEPPAVADWNPHAAEHMLHDPARAARWRDADGRWPSFKTVYREFGSWNAAVEAAGFAPRVAGGGGGNETRQRVRRARTAA